MPPMARAVASEARRAHLRWRRRARDAGRLLLLSCLGLVAVVPFLWLVFGAVKSPQEVRRIPPTFLPLEWRFDNFIRVFTVPQMRTPLHLYYANSLLVAGAHVLAVLLTSSLIGYVLAKFRFRGRRPIFWFIISTMIVPFQVTMIPSYLILSRLGLIDSLWGLIVPSMVDAFGVFVMQQFLFGVPDSLMDSARVDGASEWRIFGRIVAPQLGAPFATLGMLTFMSSWNSYLWPLIVLKSDRKRTLPIILYFFHSQQVERLELIMAASLLIIAPMMVVFLAARRWITQGLAFSGLKD
jgi:multiple sugar transport system permease protein